MGGWYGLTVRYEANECKNSQPEEDGKTRDVEVPLSPEQLHVQVVENVWLQLGIWGDFFIGVLPHLTHSVYDTTETKNMNYCVRTPLTQRLVV